MRSLLKRGRRPGEQAIGELALVFLKLGLTAFGGLGTSVGLLERELVEKRRELTPQDISEALAVAKLLPARR